MTDVSDLTASFNYEGADRETGEFVFNVQDGRATARARVQLLDPLVRGVDRILMERVNGIRWGLGDSE